MGDEKATHVLQLHIIQADYGDCFLLEYRLPVPPGTEKPPAGVRLAGEEGMLGVDQRALPADPPPIPPLRGEVSDLEAYAAGEAAHYLLVDGGPAQTYARHLKPALEEVVPRAGRLDLVVLTHIDNDHVGGIIRLLQEKKICQRTLAPCWQIGSLWHNTFRQNIGADEASSPRVLELAETAERRGLLAHLPAEAQRGLRQGEQVTQLAGELGIPINAGFKNGLLLIEHAPAPWTALGGGKGDFGDVSHPQNPPDPHFGGSRPPLDGVDQGLRVWIIGPARRHLERLHREWLAWLEKSVAAPVTRAVDQDSSIPNLSSIMLLVEAGGRKILLTGDGTGRDILEGLGASGKLDPSGKLHVDILKLPHHGSRRNVSREFFDAVLADRYLISGNGQNGNPEFGTLEWIVTSAMRQQRTIQLLATNQTAATHALIQAYPPQRCGYTIQVMQPGEHVLTV